MRLGAGIAMVFLLLPVSHIDKTRRINLMTLGSLKFWRKKEK
jgi:hypothetical protein